MVDIVVINNRIRIIDEARKCINRKVLVVKRTTLDNDERGADIWFCTLPR
jgi:hypothetical protein